MDIDHKGFDPKSSLGLDDVTLQTPMNLFNKEEASRLFIML